MTCFSAQRPLSHFKTANATNLVADELQKQETTLGSSPVSQEQDPESTLSTSSWRPSWKSPGDYFTSITHNLRWENAALSNFCYTSSLISTHNASSRDSPKMTYHLCPSPLPPSLSSHYKLSKILIPPRSEQNSSQRELFYDTYFSVSLIFAEASTYKPGASGRQNHDDSEELNLICISKRTPVL